MKKGYLHLESGEIFEGELAADADFTAGEVVFNTSMTGYQEILTDPSYAGQIIVFCYPLIGNYGLNDNDHESFTIAARGVITGELCEEPSHYKADRTITDELNKHGVPCLTGVDTRLLVRTVRKRKTVRGIITASKELDFKHSLQKSGDEFLVDQVSVKEPAAFENPGPHIVLMDFGYKKSILHALLAKGCSVTIVPYNYTYKQIQQTNPDGIIFSNGPGDPAKLNAWASEYKKIASAYPSLGICLGHQLIALAFGSKTKKLDYGHRGGNHPVKNHHTGKVFITSQNHGYTVINESVNTNEFSILYTNVNDQTIEGLKHKSLPVQTVQFHPEAHPGPSDTAFIFDEFIMQAEASRGKVYAKV